MSAAAFVTIILAVVVILVLAGFLITVARVLVDVNRALGTVIATVGTIATKTEPVNSVVESINGNLGTARDALTSLLESKVGASGAAELVASVDPMAQAPAEQTMKLRDARAPGTQPTAEPPRVRYLRESDDSAPAGDQPAGPANEPEAIPELSSSPFSGGGTIRLREPEES